MKTMKFALLVVMVGMMTLTGVSFAEAGVKLDDLQILLRWKDDRRPSEPPAPMVRHEADGPHWAPKPGGPHGHGPRRVHAPQDFHENYHGFHGAPHRPGGPGRDVPPPMPHRPRRPGR